MERELTQEQVEQLLADLAARTEHADGFTTREWADLRGISMGAAREQLRRLIRAGQLRPARVMRTSDLTGIASTVTGYQFVT